MSMFRTTTTILTDVSGAICGTITWLAGADGGLQIVVSDPTRGTTTMLSVPRSGISLRRKIIEALDSVIPDGAS